MIIAVCTLLSLLQLIRLFKLHVVTRRKLTLFSWGNIDLTSRISATERIQYVVSMNFIHIHEIFHQQGFFHCNRPNGPMHGDTEKKNWTEFSWHNNVYNAKFSIITRLEHGYAVE